MENSSENRDAVHGKRLVKYNYLAFHRCPKVRNLPHTPRYIYMEVYETTRSVKRRKRTVV